MADDLRPGLHEALVTRRLEELIARVTDELVPEVGALRNAEASDRVSRHLAAVIATAIDGAPEDQRGDEAVRLAIALLEELEKVLDGKHDVALDHPVAP